MKKARVLATATAGLLLLAVGGLAHHGTAAYDTSKTVTVEGTVTEFKFVNPHVQVYWEAKGAEGKVEQWRGEITSPNLLARRATGVKWTRNTLKPGDKLTLTGYRAKNGAPMMWILRIVGADGTVMLGDT